jgi:metallo-beta-lactamase class B
MMNTHSTRRLFLIAAAGAAPLLAQTDDLPSIEELFRRTVGDRTRSDVPFPAHKVIDNIYYVGTESFASYLITTPDGHILVNTCFERQVPILQDQVAKLGFQFKDIKIIVGSHAHGDHMEGDALAKELTGAQVMAMAEDVPALRRMMPGGKPHPIDRILHDGDEVKLGGTTMVARLTPGHSRGCTTWTLKASEGGKTYDVVIVGSVGVNPGFKLVNNPDAPDIEAEFKRSFQVLRSLPCDVPLASHPQMYNLAEKYPRLGRGPNPFIDPAGYKAEIDLREKVFIRELEAQKKAAGLA